MTAEWEHILFNPLNIPIRFELHSGLHSYYDEVAISKSQKPLHAF